VSLPTAWRVDHLNLFVIAEEVEMASRTAIVE
jgi:hypothetical protein